MVLGLPRQAARRWEELAVVVAVGHRCLAMAETEGLEALAVAQMAQAMALAVAEEAAALARVDWGLAAL